MKVVKWSHGEERGFSSLEQANQFIKHVCNKVCPDTVFQVFDVIG